MECEKPTKKHPNGRTGTVAGRTAHRRAGEEACPLCSEAAKAYSKDYNKDYYEKNKESFKDYYHSNRDRQREGRKRRYRENRECELERQKDYYRANRDQVAERAKTYRELNRDRFRDWKAKYRRENRDKYRGYDRKRAALKRGLPSERYQEEDIARAHGRKCYLCEGEVEEGVDPGSSVSQHVDHVFPLSADGSPGDILANVRITHAICNIRKGDRMIEELSLPFDKPTGNEWSYGKV